MVREKGKGKYKKENQKEKKRKTALNLKKTELEWLAENTKFDKGNIQEWHTVGVSVEN